MSTIEHRIDRTGWAAGPWDNEPNRVDFKTAAGLPAFILRAQNGALCGYVGVAPGHPLHGKDYDEFSAEVHGGLTYASSCAGPICHVPAPGEPDDVWWFGFDCAHGGDKKPGDTRWIDRPFLRELFERGEYRTLEYVRAQCEWLAWQLQREGQVRP